MKQLIKILFVALLSVSFGSCEMTYDPIVVLPNPVLVNSGLTKVATISSYETAKYAVVMSRTEGLTKPADFDVAISQAALDAYNELNGSNYTLMPSSLYTMGATKISFVNAVKTAEFDITLKPAAILAQAGSAAAAEMMVIPFVCTPTTNVNSPANRLISLVHLSFDAPTITAETSGTAALEFISVSSMPQKLTLEASTNFNVIDLNDLSYETGQSYVDDYNTANGTDYVLMPTSGYTWSDFVFDSEKYSLSREISVMCSQLSGDNIYLLPLSLKSTKYTVNEGGLYYIKATVAEITITFANDHTNRLNVKNCARNVAETFQLVTKMNAPLEADNTLSFSYDPDKIAEYNTANGTHYLALATGKVIVGADSKIAAGTTQGSVDFTVDMTDLAFETGLYLLPFTIDKSKLEYPPLNMDETVYFIFRRSLVGLWTNYWLSSNKPRPENPAPYTKSNDWHAETLDYKYVYDFVRTSATDRGYLNDRSINGRFRYMNPAGGQNEMYGWFWEVDWNGAHKGDATKKPVVFYRNVWTSNWPGANGTEQNLAKVNGGCPRQDSYYDMNEGVFYLDAAFIADYNNLSKYNASDEAGTSEVIYSRLIGPTSYQCKGDNLTYQPPMDNWY